MMKLDHDTQETLLNFALRLADSANPLLFVEAKPKNRAIGGIIVGLRRAVRGLRCVTDRDLLSMSEEEYNELVASHDYLMSIEIPQNIEKISYFPLDARNSGAFSICFSSIPWAEHNFDVFVTMELPGIFPQLIRILSNRG